MLEGFAPLEALGKTNANEVWGVLKERISAFQEQIGDNHEVGVRFGGHGSDTVIVVTKAVTDHPAILVLQGSGADDNHAEVAMHVSQVNVVFVAVPKKKGIGPLQSV